VDPVAGEDVRAPLARAVVEGGFDLLALAQSTVSLEEVFLSLTTTEAAEAPAAPGPTAEVTA
jgi:hypothetical protein